MTIESLAAQIVDVCDASQGDSKLNRAEVVATLIKEFIMKHPIQPLEKKDGTLRFKQNAIVRHLLDHGQKHGCGLNELACMNFSKEDRMQLAQLIGYSLSGYSELSYVDDDSYGAAEKMAEGKSEDAARIEHLESEHLESELAALRKELRKPMSRLFGIHPDDLTRNG